MFEELQYVGSFQQGTHFRSADPIAYSWRKLEQLGTLDNLGRIAGLWHGNSDLIRVGSLRVRQAIEFRNAAKGVSSLTRPLLLYYCVLNLLRAVMSITRDGMGHPGHGARYESSADLLDCRAVIGKKGTIVEGHKGLYGQELGGQEVTLLHCLAQMPELKSDFGLIGRGSSDIAGVRVNSFIHGDTKLTFEVQGCAPEEFKERWQIMLPWFKDVCHLDHESAFTLLTNQRFANDEQVSEFCSRHLLSDLFLRQDAFWYDHVSRERLLIHGRITPYVLMLFILSNVARYEPEKLDDVMRQPTDLAYVLNSAINNVDLFFPQLLLSKVYGKNIYFS